MTEFQTLTELEWRREAMGKMREALELLLPVARHEKQASRGTAGSGECQQV